MKKTSLLSRLSAAALLFAGLSGQAFAINDCGPDAIDPDNDGWGWENNMSCRISIVEPPTEGYCQAADSDPDGDGWGWENGASCRVNSNSSGPGNSNNTAETVQVDSTISGTLNGVTGHYYKFDVTSDTFFELDTSFLLGGSIDVYISDGQTFVLETQSGLTGACLSPGTYYLTIDRFYIDIQYSIDYSITINSTDRNCVSPVTTIPASWNDVLTTSDGSIYKYEWNSDTSAYLFSKIDYTGAVLWSTETEYFVDLIETLQDGSVAISNFNTLSLLDRNGTLLWSVDINNNYLSTMAIGEQAIVVESENNVYAYNLADGTARWQHALSPFDNIRDITFNDDGQVVVLTDQSILIFNQ